MCKAHVLRFSCPHGILMGIELCRLGPCPILKPTRERLPQQPYKCYNCENKLSRSPTNVTSSGGDSCSSAGSVDSIWSTNTTSTSPPSSPVSKVGSKVMAPLPGVARQPAECGVLARKFSRIQTVSYKSFSFSCSSSSHFVTPHYMSIPSYLPHQNHPCPPCQMEDFRLHGDREAIALAKAQFPYLTKDMLVRNGRVWEDWQKAPTLEEFVEERRTEEKEMWFHTTRKWTQDLRRAKVLVSEEDGLGLWP